MKGKKVQRGEGDGGRESDNGAHVGTSTRPRRVCVAVFAASRASRRVMACVLGPTQKYPWFSQPHESITTYIYSCATKFSPSDGPALSHTSVISALAVLTGLDGQDNPEPVGSTPIPHVNVTWGSCSETT